MLKIDRPVEPNIFFKAEAFHIASSALANLGELEGRSEPFIMNSMFSLELYLKSLVGQTIFSEPELLSEGVTKFKKVYSESKKGHDLKKLFDLLPDEIVNELEAQAHNTLSNTDLTDFFDKHKDHFIQWRYSYEGNAKSYKPADILAVLNIFNSVGRQRMQKC